MKIYVWDKKNGKTRNLFHILKEVRKQEYDLVLAVQRFFNAGLLASFSKGKKIVVFAVPAAFSPTCSQTHLPGYIENHDKLKEKGVQ